jgi:hypothetical protein
VIGCRPYEFMPEDYGKPCVVAGFEPLYLLQSILMLMRQLPGRRGVVLLARAAGERLGVTPGRDLGPFVGAFAVLAATE